MPTSHYQKDRTAGRSSNYYNGLLTGSEDEFKKLLKKYAIYPGDTVEGHRGVTIHATNGTLRVGEDDDNAVVRMGSTNTIQLNKIQKGFKTAFLNLELSARGGGGTSRGDRIEMTKTYTPTIGWVESYFLPWSDLHAVRLTIPPMGHRAAKGEPDPNLFFTAAISGCSVIFQGTPQNPTIYHCGGSTGTEFEETREFWRNVVGEFSEKELAHTGKDRGTFKDSVDKTDYVAQRGVVAKGLGGSLLKTTSRAKNYLSLLRAKHALGKLVVEDLAPWGCVLGRRAANGDWTFYLQENADITYHSVSRTMASGYGKVLTSRQTVSRPMMYREVFPNGSKTVCLRAGLPKII